MYKKGKYLQIITEFQNRKMKIKKILVFWWIKKGQKIIQIWLRITIKKVSKNQEII